MRQRILLVLLGSGAIVIPTIFISAGADVFRLPKELVFRAEAIALLALLFFRAPKLRPATWLAIGIVGWTAIVTLTSTNRALSIDSLITVVSAAILFIATCEAAESLPLAAVDVLMIGACVNAAVVILQELGVWAPVPGATGHYGAVGLLGNANYVGTFLLAPAVAAVVMSMMSSGRRRRIYLAIAVLLVAGIAAAATRTALIAFVAAMLVLALMQTRRAMLAVGAVLLVAILAVLSPATAIGQGVRKLGVAALHGDVQQLLSERLLPFVTAAQMARDHPLAGVGPGVFKYHYMSYRLALGNRYSGYPMNWGEAHNDHLQIAAEAGLIGYALFLAALAMLARRSQSPAGDARAVFARALRWPLATAIFVLCLAQFPLQLAAPRMMLLTLAALCITWDRDAGR